MFERLQLMTAKIETVYGSDAGPTGAANAILAQNVRWTPMVAKQVKREHALPFQGARPSLWVGKHVTVTFEVEAKGSGIAGTPPAIGIFLRASKCAEVIVAGTSVTYNPVSSGHESVSIYWYLDGILYKMTGARGTWKYVLNAQGIVVIEFTMTGLFTLPTSQALPTPTLGSQLTQMPQEASTANTPTFTIGAFSPALRSFAFDVRNEVVYRDLVRGEGVIIPDSDEYLQFQIETVGLATYDPYSLAASGTTQAVNLVHGIGAGKIVTLSIPRFELAPPEPLAFQDKVAETPLKGAALPTETGNNNFSLAFT